MNTKKIENKVERKHAKRTARKEAVAKPKRDSGVARGSMKKRVAKAVKGQRKR